ncbi:MAG: phosphoribosylanthranilate isomerase [Acetobacter sp.]|nr:phosphoribosylanthranilate isomerase [Bacteroides sp.]MCM1341316.1 phosphoribosylanthranilate isomerase [Acetobacter sp.]MCM1433908.1 phosphoribosylanthranilate isomerase [Clostridiales bacterium]
MARIKICGLRRSIDVEYVNDLNPDYIGFILSAGFKRSITADEAKKLKKKLSPDIKAVGVFVNEDENYINSIVEDKIIDIAQLHGNESPQLCRNINAPVIKYFNPDSFDRINEYNDSADYFLFDSGTGTGRSFDWSKLPKTDKPFFLAGGINESNIYDAIEKINPFCIDLSSAVETNGFKDYKKIQKIMEIIV